MAAHMKKSLLPLLISCVLLHGTERARAQLPAPVQAPSDDAQAFQAVHLLWVDAQQPRAEERIRAAIGELNGAIRKAGCPGCVYHLWRVSEGAPGGYNYMQQSNWPSRAMYDKVHNSPDYVRASRGWVALRSLVTREVYVRQSEVPVESTSGSMAASAMDVHRVVTSSEATSSPIPFQVGP